MKLLEKIILLLMVCYFTVLPISNAAMELFSHLLLVVGLIYLGLNREILGLLGRLPKILLVGLGGYILFSSLSILLKTPEGFNHFKAIADMRWIFILLMLSLFWTRFYKSAWQYKYHVLLFLLFLTSVYGIVQALSGFDFWRDNNLILNESLGLWRSSGLFSTPLTYAYVHGVLGLIILGGVVVSQKNYSNWRKMYLTLVFLFCVLAVFLSQTRGAWIGLAVTFITLLFLYPVRRVYVLNLGMMLFLGVSILASEGVSHRISNMVNVNEPSNMGRINIWNSHIKVFNENIFLGVGHLNNKNEMFKFCKDISSELCFSTHGHNIWINSLSASGLIGTFFLLLFCWSMLFINWDLLKKNQSRDFKSSLLLGAFLAQIFFFIGGLTECVLIDSEVNHAMIWVWAMVAGFYLKSQEVKKAVEP